MEYRNKARRAFTLVELLVVIGIIALLVGILIPVISKVRTSAYVADTRNWLVQIDGAIVRYHNDFHAYPGPITNAQIYIAPPPFVITTMPPTGFDATGLASQKTSMSENLVLGLLGGLNLTTAGAVQYDPSQVGLGPMNLNPANPKRYPAYLEATNLSWKTVAGVKTGRYSDDAGAADDSMIPEFVDRFPDPMPLLYLRSKIGVDIISTGISDTNNSVITKDLNNAATPPRAGAYDISQIYGYVSKPIGTGKTLSYYVKGAKTAPPATPTHGLVNVGTLSVLGPSNDSKYQYPYDAFPYFQSPNSPNVPRQKDSYILISPGKDRVYGTSDDICNFGEVNP